MFFSLLVSLIRAALGAPPPVDAKPAEESWTLWLNGLLAVAGLVVEIAPRVLELPWVAENATVAGWVMFVVGVANFLLRLKSEKAVK